MHSQLLPILPLHSGGPNGEIFSSRPIGDGDRRSNVFFSVFLSLSRCRLTEPDQRHVTTWGSAEAQPLVATLSAGQLLLCHSMKRGNNKYLSSSLKGTVSRSTSAARPMPAIGTELIMVIALYVFEYWMSGGLPPKEGVMSCSAFLLFYFEVCLSCRQ